MTCVKIRKINEISYLHVHVYTCYKEALWKIRDFTVCVKGALTILRSQFFSEIRNIFDMLNMFLATPVHENLTYFWGARALSLATPCGIKRIVDDKRARTVLLNYSYYRTSNAARWFVISLLSAVEICKIVAKSLKFSEFLVKF